MRWTNTCKRRRRNLRYRNYTRWDGRRNWIGISAYRWSRKYRVIAHWKWREIGLNCGRRRIRDCKWFGQYNYNINCRCMCNSGGCDHNFSFLLLLHEKKKQPSDGKSFFSDRKDRVAISKSCSSIDSWWAISRWELINENVISKGTTRSSWNGISKWRRWRSSQYALQSKRITFWQQTLNWCWFHLFLRSSW